MVVKLNTIYPYRQFSVSSSAKLSATKAYWRLGRFIFWKKNVTNFPKPLKHENLWPGTDLFVSAGPAPPCSLSVFDSTAAAGHTAETSSPPKDTHTDQHLHNRTIHITDMTNGTDSAALWKEDMSRVYIVWHAGKLHIVSTSVHDFLLSLCQHSLNVCQCVNAANYFSDQQSYKSTTHTVCGLFTFRK